MGWKTRAPELYAPIFCGQHHSERAAGPEPAEVGFTLTPLRIITKIPVLADVLLIYEPNAPYSSSEVRSRGRCQAMLVEWSGSPDIVVLGHLVKLSIFSLVEEPDEVLLPLTVWGAIAG